MYVQCPYCRKIHDVQSDHRQPMRCPSCGGGFVPLENAVKVEGLDPGGSGPGGVQLIEKTAKSWKLLQLIGAVGFIVGIPLSIGNCKAIMSGSPGLEGLVGISLLVGGAVFWIWGRGGAWWHHG